MKTSAPPPVAEYRLWISVLSIGSAVIVPTSTLYRCLVPTNNHLQMHLNLFQLNRLTSGIEWICIEYELKPIEEFIRDFGHILFVFGW